MIVKQTTVIQLDALELQTLFLMIELLPQRVTGLDYIRRESIEEQHRVKSFIALLRSQALAVKS